MSRFYSKRHNQGQRIDVDQFRPGLKIHLTYTNFACHWILQSVEPKNSKGEVWLNLIAPDSDKRKRTNAIYARHIRANEQ